MAITARVWPLNVTDAESIETVLKAINDEFGAIDILVNNAGITRDNLLMRMKDDEWSDILDTNLTSIFRMSKAVLRGMMKKRNGRIINVGPVVGTMGNAGQANWRSSKKSRRLVLLNQWRVKLLRVV